MDWLLLFKALCLVLVIEGIVLFAAPRRLRDVAQHLARLDDRTLRMAGFAVMLVGAALISLIGR